MAQEKNKSNVNAIISLKKETPNPWSLSGIEIPYTLADRTIATDKNGHYFSTFNIPYKNDLLLSGNTTAKNNPEMLQLNVDKIVIIPIKEKYYNEYIDGKSITLTIPQIGGINKTIISTFYSDISGNGRISNSPIQYFGPKNIAFLFSDDVNTPYTGTTEGGVAHTRETWNPINISDRPIAVSYNKLENIDKNTDNRTWSSVKKAVNIPQQYPDIFASQNTLGYNYDIPVGFASLDKGCIILTHPDIVNNIPWGIGSTSHIDASGNTFIDGSNSGSTTGTTNIVFTAATSTLTYTDISIRYLTSIVCVAMPATFFISKNPSWPIAKNLTEFANGGYNYDSIFVTQIGLYNAYDELIAIAKLDRPIEKTYDGIISFNLEIDI